jgi:hypothetical protein
MLESRFKADFKDEIKRRIPHVKMYEPKTNRRGRPDLILLGPGTWAAIEFKREEDAPRQPNQEKHMDELAEMGYSCFAYPEIAEEVLGGLERLFETF